MAPRKRGKSARKARAAQRDLDDQHKDAPHSFVFNRGNLGKYLKQLMLDVRKVQEPYTATRLRATKPNTLQDFVNNAGTFGVSHFLVFSRNDPSLFLKLMKIPRGPTLTFRILSYTLAKDVVSSVKRPVNPQFMHHPLLIMSGLDQSRKEHKLIHSTFQSLYPPINVHETPLNNIRRCVLVNFDPESETLELRHYGIRLAPVGVSKAVKKIMQNKVPKMGKYEDIADYLLNPGATSESEAEVEPNEVEIAQDVKERGVSAAGKCSVRLTEMGPRMTLQLVRIQSEVASGTVLWSSLPGEEGAQTKPPPKRRRKRKVTFDTSGGQEETKGNSGAAGYEKGQEEPRAPRKKKWKV